MSSSHLLLHNRASFISVHEFVGSGGGGLNCEAKAQVLVVMPSPLFIFGSRSQKGGDVTAGQYGIWQKIEAECGEYNLQAVGI